MEEDIKILEEYLKNLQYIGNTIIMSDEIVKVIDYKEIKAIENLLERYKELEAEVESQDKTIDKLVEEQEEREKYTHSLEEENAKLRIDNTEKLCEECSELAKQSGITEEDTRKILKDYRDKVENSIPISVIQNTLDNIDRELEEKYSAEKISVFSGNTYMEKFKLLGSRQVLQELLEERRK